jgi:HSP20 family molecular chaperone IbpA
MKNKMENWLGNKTLLHSLLRQADVANTINGGTSETFLAVENKENEVVILVSAAGVHSSDFKVRLHKNKLTISRHLHAALQGTGQESLFVPVFLRHFDLPSVVDKGKIKAYFEDGLLRIVLPLQDARDLNKEIKIEGY